MKKIQSIPLKFILLAVAALGMFYTSCTKEDIITADDNETFLALTSAIDSNVTTGNWVIDKFKKDSNILTADYSGYIFTFNTNGDLMASMGGNDYLGSWYIDTVSCTKDSCDVDNKGKGNGNGKGKGNGKGNGKDDDNKGNGNGKGKKDKLKKVRLAIDFQVGNSLDSLSNSWRIIKYSDSLVRLKAKKADSHYFLSFKRN